MFGCMFECKKSQSGGCYSYRIAIKVGLIDLSELVVATLQLLYNFDYFYHL